MGSSDRLLKQITAFFLRAKPWQVFLLICGTYVGGQIALLASMPDGDIKSLDVVLVAEVIMSPTIVCLMGWLWSVGWFLCSISEASLKMNFRVFRFAVIFATVYMFTALLLFFSRSSIVILPLHLLAMWCLFYIAHFNAKSLRIAETGKRVK